MPGMTILTPLWMQNGTYPARFDRLLIQRAFGDHEIVFTGLVITQNGAGDVSVNASLGSATIMGDDQTDQGMYLVWMDANQNVPMPAVPGSNKRIDIVSLRINDPQAGGPVGNNATWVITQGTASATPVAPTVPTSAIPIAQVLRTAGDAAVLTSQLTDVAARAGGWPYQISTGAVPAKMPGNFLYVKVA